MILHLYIHTLLTYHNQRNSVDPEDMFFLGPQTIRKTPISAMPQANGPIHVEFSIMRNVMASSIEDELGGLFDNCQNYTSILTYLAQKGHPQPPTPVAIYNSAEIVL